MSKKVKQSETITINRSHINLNPVNPKKHSKEAIEEQKRNFKYCGFLGGLVWNKTTGNLISGHKRLMTLDLINGYDGSETTDYEVKVESIELTIKQEREQLIYMDSKRTNTPQDYELLALIIPELDIKNTGLNQYDIDIIKSLVPESNFGDNEQIKKDIEETELDYNKKIEHNKNVKSQMNKNNASVQQASHFTVIFETYNDKAEYLESIGINGDDVFITSDTFLSKLNQE
jgi:hypothetical protein